MNRFIYLSVLTSSLLFATEDVEQLKKQLQEQSKMILELSQRLNKLENSTDKEVYAEKEPSDKIDVFQNTQAPSGGSFNQSQFVPNISLVLDTSLVARNKSEEELSELSMPGIGEGFYGGGGHEGHSHGAANSENGFNLNYVEMVVSSNVDPYFSMDATFHFSEESVDIEEAFFTSTALDNGLKVKGGKFYSDFGRMNKQHQHLWDFSDAPLIYIGFLGYEGLNEKGIQLQYTPALDNYLMVGAEVLQGENGNTFGIDTININGESIEGASAPSLFVGYIKTAMDIGDTTIMPGVSYAHGQSRSSHDHDGHEEAFDGKSSLYNVELTIKSYFDSYSFISWQSEWMRREQDGTAYHVEAGVTEANDQKITQEGIYSQVVYAYDQNWRTGLRYDSIYKNEIFFTEDELPPTPYERYSAMLEYHFSEFSRLRLEYTYNQALYDEDFKQQDVHSAILSLNVAIGAHAAHDF